MEDNFEYQIFVGCSDLHSKDEVVKEHELREMVTLFFMREKIDFSILSAHGGYTRRDGTFITENSLCVNIIGSSDLDIIRLARGLSMFMNQECSLIVKNRMKAVFI